MVKKPYSLMSAMLLCLLVAVAAVPVLGQTADSTTWAGSWEGTTLPYDGGSGQFGVYWFNNGSPDNTNFEIANTVLDSAGFLNINTTGVTGDQNLWYTKAVTFDFDAGVSVEWRFRSHFGTANSGQNLLSLYDSAQNENIFMNLQYPDGNTGLINFTFGGQSFVFPMNSSVPGNDFHTFRMTVLGSVANIYVDDNPIAQVTAAPTAGVGLGLASGGLEWGDKLMQSDFDYIRWTTDGAFPPVSIPLNPPSKFSHKWEGSWEGDVLPYDNGVGQFGVYWFNDGLPNDPNFEIANTVIFDMPYKSEPGNPYGAQPGNQAVNINTTGASGDQNLWYTKAVTFDFDAGVSVEWRFKSHFGTANSGQNFLSLYDSAQNENIFMNLQYPNANPTGVINFTFGGQSFVFPMKSSVPGNGFHTFRMTVLGSVANIYVDDNSIAQVTAAPTSGLGFAITGGGLEWGDKLMQADFDYLRWTTGGAFPPPTDCELLWEGTIGGLEQDMNHDCSVDELDLIEWIASWLDCNDPTGCP